MNYSFPEHFLWGGATAANQCEGAGKSKRRIDTRSYAGRCDERSY